MAATFPSCSLSPVWSRNLIADLSLNSQANSIYSPDTSICKTPKSAARVCSPGPASVWLDAPDSQIAFSTHSS